MAFRDGQKACLLCDTGGPSPAPDSFSWDADCLAADLVDHFVHVTGPKVAGIRQVTKVDVEDATTMPAVGVIIAKASATRCTVQVLGELAVAGLSPSTVNRYWVGADSKLAALPPSRVSGKLVVAQVAGIPLDSSTLELRPDLNPVKLRG